MYDTQAPVAEIVCCGFFVFIWNSYLPTAYYITISALFASPSFANPELKQRGLRSRYFCQLVVAVEHLHRIVAHHAEAVDEFLQLTALGIRVQLVAVNLHRKKNLSMVVEYAACATDTIDRNA